VGISHEKSGSIDLLISKVRAKLTSYLYVRDKGSFNYLKSHNFRLAGVFPDLAFYLYGGENIHVRSISADKQKACFSFRFDSDNENSKENVKAFIMSVVKRGIESDSYVFISQVKRDDVHMVQLAEWFLSATGFKADVVLCSESIEDMMALYSGCHTVYSNRLHVLLLSGFSGAMPVAVIDMKLNKKVADLYQDIGIEGLIVDIHQSLTYVPVFDRELLDACLQTQYLRLKQMFPEIISAETY
jgi:polysaccharide pyruvyl transferase WcaK-like protein